MLGGKDVVGIPQRGGARLPPDQLGRNAIGFDGEQQVSWLVEPMREVGILLAEVGVHDTVAGQLERTVNLVLHPPRIVRAPSSDQVDGGRLLMFALAQILPIVAGDDGTPAIVLAGELKPWRATGSTLGLDLRQPGHDVQYRAAALAPGIVRRTTPRSGLHRF